MGNRFSRVLALAFLFLTNFASADDIVSLSFTKQTGLTLHAELGKTHCLEKLTVRYKGKEIGPPPEAYRDICGVILEELKMTEYGISSLSDLRPMRVLAITYAPDDANEPGIIYSDLPRIDFIIRGTCTERRTRWEPGGEFGVYTEEAKWPCEW